MCLNGQKQFDRSGQWRKKNTNFNVINNSQLIRIYHKISKTNNRFGLSVVLKLALLCSIISNNS